MNSILQSGHHPEATLLVMASDGDLDAFNELVLAYQNMTYNYALALLNNADLAENVTQESFIKAFQALHSFRQGSFRGWLLKIVTNSAYDVLRKSKRHRPQPPFLEGEHGEVRDTPVWIADPAASIQDIGKQNELSRNIYETIDMYELDYKAAANRLRVPMGKIKSHLARGRLQVIEKLSEHKNRQLCLYGPA